MENLTAVQIRDFVIVLLAILAFIVLAGNALKTWRNWKKPVPSLSEKRTWMNLAWAFLQRIRTSERRRILFFPTVCREDRPEDPPPLWQQEKRVQRGWFPKKPDRKA